MVQVAQYESDLSDEVVEENNDLNQNKKVKKKKRSKHWVKEATFDNAEEAEESVENIWSKQYTNYTDHGRRVYYRCNKAKLRGPQCSASIHLLYHADSDQVTVYKTEGEHDHHDEKVRGIDENVKKCIEELYNDGIMKSKQIIRALQTRKMKMPTLIQIKNYLVQYKKKKYGLHKISLGELEQWCEGNVEVPIDENKAFVASYKILYDNEEYEDDEDIEEDGNKLRIFISSVRLLNIASMSSHFHADATYKLVWQGFPVLIVGTTDFNKAFHPFGLAVCSNEKTKDFEFIFNSIQVGMQKINKDLLKPTALISDAAGAIKNGFTNIFGSSYNQIMCWAHMKRKVNNRVCQIDDKHIAKEIIEDIEMLQLSNSTEVFKLASTLFIKKWNMNNKQKNESILDFMNYFHNEWLKTNDGWYEGIQVYTPSTNNALEATNRTIKDDGTFRERHILSRFLTIASNIVNNWSIERDITSINGKIFATEPTISLELWTLSYQWAKSTKDIICISNDSSKIYYIPARDLQSISQASLNKYKNKTWSTFNQFTKSFDIWCMEMDNGSDWRKSKCNCPGFFKNYICKHVVGMAIRLKYCKPPPSAKTVPIGEKRKRGRPAKAKPALLVQ
ncbi:unnamed protein product [Rotaria sordida]|uniref:SWIM-type domain-containing protein n=3 Tax=Rotaria sordida TaxID=392033 RepID=A0A815YQ01_9BILA|nr:unnamed protein product [Rotaria sordida]CAF1573115.1 unnamed protein product [Rotaria sordida]